MIFCPLDPGLDPRSQNVVDSTDSDPKHCLLVYLAPVGSLVGSLVDWLVGCLVGCLVGWLVGSLVRWFVGWSTLLDVKFLLLSV